MMTTLSASLNAFALTAREGRTREPLDILLAEVLGRLGALHFGATRAGTYGEEDLDVLLLP
jgi:hypothetical protein